MGDFWNDAWGSFKAAFGPVMTAAAFLLALLGPLYAPTATIKVDLIWIGVAGLLLLTLLWTAVTWWSQRAGMRGHACRARGT